MGVSVQIEGMKPGYEIESVRYIIFLNLLITRILEFESNPRGAPTGVKW